MTPAFSSWEAISAVGVCGAISTKVSCEGPKGVVTKYHAAPAARRIRRRRTRRNFKEPPYMEIVVAVERVRG
jgi:hypothetical protein